MSFQSVVHGERYVFADLVELFAKAGEAKSGDQLAGVAAYSAAQRVAARRALADVRLSEIVANPLIEDAVTDLINDGHDELRFGAVCALTVGEFRELVLRPEFSLQWDAGLAAGITPEIAAAVAKIMTDRDLVVAAKPLRTVTRCRNSMGGTGVFGIGFQLDQPTDDIEAFLLLALDGLALGCGDAVVSVDPGGASTGRVERILHGLATLVGQLGAPAQTCVLGHLTTQLGLMEAGAPVDLLSASVAGTQRADRAFGITLDLLAQAREAVLEHHRERAADFSGDQVMYFEAGQGNALSVEAHHGVDQLTLSARAFGVARAFDPFLVSSVIGSSGGEYLAGSRQIIRAGLEDHFVGKLLGLPMGCDVSYAAKRRIGGSYPGGSYPAESYGGESYGGESYGGDVDTGRNTGADLLLLLAAAGSNHVTGVTPDALALRNQTLRASASAWGLGALDVQDVQGPQDVQASLHQSSTGFRDVVGMRELFGLTPAPEFAAWAARRAVPPRGRFASLDDLNLSTPVRRSRDAWLPADALNRVWT
ncbi:MULTISPECIES: ethanolamine ammonia-lyase subunit EutB [unclassified Frankia]|uniref:ethanolamine ammonia-lyase subunit EutB n=1 Tax=unclassified Frankia TaxID=2632575 RepID=UPI002AD4DAA1|nr:MULTISPECIES: ethanolamine ammonia-lyase subunit EutB [unclassified Frankia]